MRQRKKSIPKDKKGWYDFVHVYAAVDAQYVADDQQIIALMFKYPLIIYHALKNKSEHCIKNNWTLF